MKKVRSGTVMLLVLIAIIAGLLTAANLRLRSHRRTASTIAVLPFLSGTTDRDAAKLCDELTTKLINNLSSTPNLHVSSAESVAPFKGPILNPQLAGKKLNVDVVVVGRVEKHGNQFLIQTDLVNVIDESQLWGQEYQRPASPALSADVANDISQNVLKALFPKN